MSEIVQTQAPEESTGPTFELGSVNVDSLMNLLNKLGDFLPFRDEASKVAYHAQASSLNMAGDPADVSSDAGKEEISDLEAQVANLQAELAQARANQIPPTNEATATPTAEGAAATPAPPVAEVPPTAPPATDAGTEFVPPENQGV